MTTAIFPTKETYTRQDDLELEEIWTKDDDKALAEALQTIKEAEARIEERNKKISAIDERIAEIEEKLLEIKKEKELQSEKEEKKSSKIANVKEKINKILKIGAVAIPLATAPVQSAQESFDKSDDKNKLELKDNLSAKVDFPTTLTIGPETWNKRFDNEVYKSLSEYGKEIYKFFAENNPTPGRSYSFVEPDSSTQYIFDENNILIDKWAILHGATPGDEPNTSNEFKEGLRTTASGIYLWSKAGREEDKKEYGDNYFNLYGFTIHGKKNQFGWHRLYTEHNQGPIRATALASPTPDDNAITDGCGNVAPENFPILNKHFVGDYGEILIVVPDKVTTEKLKKEGKTFDVGELVKMITPNMIKMTGEVTEKIYNPTITKTVTEMQDLGKTLIGLKEKIAKQSKEDQKATRKNAWNTFREIGKKGKILTETYRKRDDLLRAKKSMAMLGRLKKPRNQLT